LRKLDVESGEFFMQFAQNWKSFRSRFLWWMESRKGTFRTFLINIISVKLVAVGAELEVMSCFWRFLCDFYANFSWEKKQFLKRWEVFQGSVGSLDARKNRLRTQKTSALLCKTSALLAQAPALRQTSAILRQFFRSSPRQLLQFLMTTSPSFRIKTSHQLQPHLHIKFLPPHDLSAVYQKPSPQRDYIQISHEYSTFTRMACSNLQLAHRTICEIPLRVIRLKSLTF
jgi:hypothetical protein